MTTPPIAPAPAPVPSALVFPPLSGQYLVLPAAAVDGDTFDFYWLFRDRCRVRGINAPELKGETHLAGLEAKAYLAGMLPNAPTVLTTWGREKYGRCLADLTVNGQSLARAIIQAGHAVPFMDH